MKFDLFENNWITPSNQDEPKGTIEINENGEHNVKKYATAKINVPSKPTQSRNILPNEEIQTITPDEGYLFSSVTVEAIPSEYIVPSDTITIIENGNNIDVAQYAEANVNVPIPSGYVDTSAATATAADITLGKTAAANGEMLTGTLVVPEEGLIFSDYDASDGFPRTVTISYKNKIPNSCCLKFGNPDGQWATPFTGHVNKFNILNGPIICGSYVFANMQNQANTVFEFPQSITTFSTGTFNNTECDSVIVNGKIDGLGTNSWTGKYKKCFFNGGVNRLSYMGGSTVCELYDFSGCDAVPSLSGTGNQHFAHADGCVIRVPQSLLSEWQEETNWIDLPTDPSVSGYVVWEGV